MFLLLEEFLVKAPAGRKTVAKNEVRYEQNDLQSVVRRATCEWRAGVQHGSLRYESGCKLCCKCGKLNKLIYRNLFHTIATQGQWVGLFLCLAFCIGKNNLDFLDLVKIFINNFSYFKITC